MDPAEGFVFQIQHFSVHDGPGIRSTVFFNGCLLDCAWCHNPEGKMRKPYVVFEESKCRLCRACESICKNHCHAFSEEKHVFQKEACIQCGACVKACFYGALHWVGKKRSAFEVMEEVRKDLPYFQESGGGMTLSGGEPALQWKYAKSLFQLAKSYGIHCCMETSGYAGRKAYEELLPVTDLFLYDCKETDPKRHKLFTGKDLDVIHGNLFYLDENGANLILRCPVIPGCNDREEHLQGIAKLCAKLHHLKGVELLPYHALGVSKARRLGLTCQAKYKVPSREQMKAWEAYLKEKQLPVIESGT